MGRLYTRDGRLLTRGGALLLDTNGCGCCGGGGGGDPGPGCACCELNQGPCAWEKCYGELTRSSASVSATGGIGTVVYNQGQNDPIVLQYGTPTANASNVDDFTIVSCIRSNYASNSVEQNIGSLGGCTDVVVKTEVSVSTQVNFFNTFNERADQKACNVVEGPKLIEGQIIEITATGVSYITDATCPPDGSLNSAPNGWSEATISLHVTVNIANGVWNGDATGSGLLGMIDPFLCDTIGPRDPRVTGFIAVTHQGGVCGGIVQFEAEMAASFIDNDGAEWKTAMRIAGSAAYETGDCRKGDIDLEPLIPNQAILP